MEFKEGTPINTRLDILQSMIRQRERAIVIAKEKRAQLKEDIGQLSNEANELREQFKDIAAKRAEE
jgi:septal ring factor EnvC (AmiA/AmiB activator)